MGATPSAGSPCCWRSSRVSLSAGPGFWQAATQADFLRGEVDQLSIDEHGRLTLGPELARVHDAGGAVCLDRGGRRRRRAVPRHRQRRQGDQGRRRAARRSVFYDSTEMEVHALAAGAGWRLVRRHLARWPHLQASTRRARPRRSSIPTTNTSGRSPSIATATSSPAPATRAPSTRSRPTARARSSSPPKTAHAVALAFDQNRQLLVGTGTPGRVFRVDGAGKGFLLLDTTYQEVRALRVDPKGVIYAAAQSSRAAGRRRQPQRRARRRRRRSRRRFPTSPPRSPRSSVVDLGSASQSGASSLVRGSAQSNRRGVPRAARRVVGRDVGVA